MRVEDQLDRNPTVVAIGCSVDIGQDITGSADIVGGHFYDGDVASPRGRQFRELFVIGAPLVVP